MTITYIQIAIFHPSILKKGIFMEYKCKPGQSQSILNQEGPVPLD